MNDVFVLRMISSSSRKLIFIVAGTLLLYSGCTRSQKQAKEPRSVPSGISVAVNNGGPIVLTTSTAEFQVLPSGYLQASLVKGGKKLSLDEPRQGGPAESNYLVQDRKEIH